MKGIMLPGDATEPGWGGVAMLLLAAALLSDCTGGKAMPAGSVESAAKATPATADSAKAEADRALETALLDFEKAVIRRDTARLLELLDPDYRRKELGGFFKGNTTQFFDEFFCGRTVKGDQLHCVALNDISLILRAEMAGMGNTAGVVYHVTSPVGEIQARLQVTLGKAGEVNGFIGSNGYTQVE